MDKALKISWLVIASCLLLGAQQGVQMVIMTGPPGAVGPVGMLDEWPMNEGSGSNFFDAATTNPATIPINQGSGGTNTWGAVAGWPATPITFATPSGFSGGGFRNLSALNYSIATGAVAFSSCGWINATSLSPANSLVVSNENPGNANIGWELGFLTNHLYFSLIHDAGATNYLQVEQNGTVTTAANHQVCVTYTGSGNASGVTLYVDGSSVASTINQNTLSLSTASEFIAVGQRFDNVSAAQGSFKGTVGYVSVWNCVLTGGVISTNNAAGPSFTGLHC